MNQGSRQIRKRDGTIAKFDQCKIEQAIMKAMGAIGDVDAENAVKLAGLICQEVEDRFHHNSIPAVEEVQDIVEDVLMEQGRVKIAKTYILYRQKRTEIREMKKSVLGFIDSSKLTLNGAIIAKEKYLQKNEQGQVIETPLELFERVAKNMASGEKNNVKEEFYDIMSSLKFIPAGRTLANAGTQVNQLMNAYVVPIYDSLEDIFNAIRDQAMIQKAGGGTGFDFSRIRPKGDTATISGGVAAGPVAFLDLFNKSSETIRIGSRHSSNMGILRVDHPDIIEFIRAKTKDGALTSFNISVAVTDEFMRALVADREYDLINPRTGKAVKRLPARQVFDMMITTSWQTGDPGVIFIDRINKYNPTSHVGRIDATSACAETPLHPYESSNLGSINISRLITAGRVDYNEIKRVVRIAVRLLDNAIETCNYPLDLVEQTTKQMRRIGLGVMGWADMLYQLGIPYDSDEAVRLARKIMKTISQTASEMSCELAKEKGEFPLYRGSRHHKEKIKRRNATLTAIAPTGSISMLAETSSGIEPNYGLAFVKRVLDGREFLYVNKHFEKVARKQGFYSEELMRRIARQGNLQGIKEVPAEVKAVFKTSHEIGPDWHVKMQAAFQKYVESAISKTVNFSNSATIKDVEGVYMLAYKEGCKGITIYRDGSKSNQVLNPLK